MTFKKGQSGNPKGRPKRADLAAFAARKYTEEAVLVLAKQLKSDKEEVAARAATALIERGWGKPTEHVEMDIDADITSAVGISDTDRILADIAARRKKAASEEPGEDGSILPVGVSPQA